MKKPFTLLFLIFIISFHGQESKSIYPDFSNQTLKEVLKHKKWKSLIRSKGFLNSDKSKDVVLILESKDSILEKRIDFEPQKNIGRIFLVLINNKVIIQNNIFLARADEGGMLNYIEPEVEIKNNQLKIHYQYIRSNTTYNFKYKKNDLILINAKSNDVQSATGNYEFLNYNFEKKILEVKTGNISKKGETNKKIPLKLKNVLKKLSEFTQMYEWEVLKDRYL